MNMTDMKDLKISVFINSTITVNNANSEVPVNGTVRRVLHEIQEIPCKGSILYKRTGNIPVEELYLEEPTTGRNIAHIVLTSSEKIEYFFHSSSSYLYFTGELNDKIRSIGYSGRKKKMSKIFSQLCEKQKCNFIQMRDSMSKLSLMISEELGLTKKDQSKCWNPLNNELVEMEAEFDDYYKSEFDKFLKEKKRTNEEFMEFVKDIIYIWNKFTRENRYTTYIKLYKSLKEKKEKDIVKQK
ncbi:Plasmodium exported protein (PHIST), unknown function [Plasmodium ovale wallikeri]|uniref:Plasmodium RESA N-terminal domain-containing protein n=1 Tax=Plasmodium ovale wallikeri TaxID=864142 RepID=A0A1A8YLB2_PLAOA|nr:Plasmodium exported protein (PHIST), unknown function [Plasmodium ovale wallikeri]SBT58226.1 Phist protein (Pf-fam-b), unknown function [Plasmodium ovale wallikeri]